MFISESFSVASLLSRNKNFKSALSYFYRSSFCSFCLVVSLLLQKAFPSTGDLEHTATSSERCMHWQKLEVDDTAAVALLLNLFLSPCLYLILENIWLISLMYGNKIKKAKNDAVSSILSMIPP